MTLLGVLTGYRSLVLIPFLEFIYHKSRESVGVTVQKLSLTRDLW